MNPFHLTGIDAVAGKPEGRASVFFIPSAGSGRIVLELEMPTWDAFRPLGDLSFERRAAVNSLITP